MSEIRSILATGTTGYLGRHVVHRFESQGIAVTPLVRDPSQLIAGSPGILIQDDASLVQSIVSAAPQALLHIAATGGVESDPSAMSAIIRSNVTLGALLMEACAQIGNCRFVGIGSFSQLSVTEQGTHPNSFYSASKDALESFASYFSAVRGVSTTFLLPTDIYGPGDERTRLLKLMALATTSTTPLDVTPGDQIVSFVHVHDVVDAILTVLASEDEASPQVARFGVMGPQIAPLRETVDSIATKLDIVIPVRWGGRDYRENEVLLPGLLEPPPGWSPTIDVADGFRELLEETA